MEALTFAIEKLTQSKYQSVKLINQNKIDQSTHQPIFLSTTQIKQRANSGKYNDDSVDCIDVKTFLRFFYFGHVFTFFDVFLFSKRFLFLKNVGKVQSGKQIN